MVERPESIRGGRGFEMNEKFYTYILVSEKSGTYYIGHSGDIEERIKLHNSGKVTSTEIKVRGNAYIVKNIIQK